MTGGSVGGCCMAGISGSGGSFDELEEKQAHYFEFKPRPERCSHGSLRVWIRPWQEIGTCGNRGAAPDRPERDPRLQDKGQQHFLEVKRANHTDGILQGRDGGILVSGGSVDASLRGGGNSPGHPVWRKERSFLMSRYYKRTAVLSPGEYAGVAVILIVAAVLLVHSCTSREQKKVARDEVGVAVLNLEHRQEVINRILQDK